MQSYCLTHYLENVPDNFVAQQRNMDYAQYTIETKHKELLFGRFNLLGPLGKSNNKLACVILFSLPLGFSFSICLREKQKRTRDKKRKRTKERNRDRPRDKQRGEGPRRPQLSKIYVDSWGIYWFQPYSNVSFDDYTNEKMSTAFETDFSCFPPLISRHWWHLLRQQDSPFISCDFLNFKGRGLFW